MTYTAPDLSDVLERVRAHEPARKPQSKRGFAAATAMILAGGADPSMLIIERASRPGDRWSGDAALPGGKRDPGDIDLLTTARRETLEEVAITLPTNAIGQLDDVGGRAHPGHVTTYVFHIPEPLPTVPEPSEVARALWIPLSVLADPSRRGRHPTRMGPFPAIVHEGLTIWGMTYGIVQRFIEITTET